MREETRRRLGRALLVQRLKWAGAVGAVLAGVGAIGYFTALDATIATTKSIEGTVVYVGPLSGKVKAAVAESSLQVDIRLDDARVAHLIAPRERAPAVGEHLKIAEKIHGSGRHTFDWR